MSFQRITSSGSTRAMKRVETLSCRIWSATSSSSRSSARCARESWKPSSSVTASASFPAEGRMVADVVEGSCEPVHVVPVERRDERAVQEVDQLVREAVTLVLELLHRPCQLIGPVRKPVEQLDEPLGDRDDVLRRLV